MNNFLTYSAIFIISLTIIGCGGKKNPNPDTDQLENKTQQTDILNVFADSIETSQTEHFYKLENIVKLRYPENIFCSSGNWKS